MKTTLMTTACALAIGLTSSTANAGHDIDTLAHTLKEQADCLRSEVRNFRHAGCYRQLTGEARAIQRLARHICEIVHQPTSLRHILRDLDDLDDAVDDFEDLVDDLGDAHPVRGRRNGYIYRGGFEPHFGNAHANRFHLARLCKRLKELECTIDRMEDAVEDALDCRGPIVRPRPAPPVVHPRPAPPDVFIPRPPRRNGSVIRFGRPGGFSFSLVIN